MPYDAGLAARLADVTADMPDMVEQKMFGGIGYMLGGNMCVGIYKDFLILRLGEEGARQVLAEPHASPMDITGRVMKGWAKIAPEGIAEDAELARYVAKARDFVATLPAKT
jgi:TfoX/Sxy family transcriptional regulator of competence genes